ncbi:MAG TPA: NAD(P)H-binding protein [Kofleriaceae bacterium]|nr:NAD(P)H-binding protein [Kofleriaceae bacterium]
MTFLITGATGNIGALVVERLIARGERPRVFVRDAGKARARFGERVEVAAGDLTDAGSLASALGGVSAMLLVTSGPALAELDAAAARVASGAGVGLLVKLSSLDARHGVGTGIWHARGEAAIRDSGVAHTFVQPTGFMSNALYWARGIREAGAVRSATGDGKIPFVHPADIADVAVAALTTRAHVGAALPLTGPVPLSYGEMTAQIAEAIERPLQFSAMSDDDARRQQIAWGTEPAMVEARLSIFRAIRDGQLAEVSDGVERALGRAPRSFAQWTREHAAAFR